jgi:hypothetical protein
VKYHKEFGRVSPREPGDTTSRGSVMLGEQPTLAQTEIKLKNQKL